jgi:hypothetical protein
MKEEAPLRNPFIREPRGGRPAKEGGRAAIGAHKTSISSANMLSKCMN